MTAKALPGLKNLCLLSSFVLTCGASFLGTALPSTTAEPSNCPLSQIEERNCLADAQTADQTRRAEQYIGLKYHGHYPPEGLQDLGGWVIESSDFAIARFQSEAGHMIWFQDLLNRDAQGRASWTVLDTRLMSSDYSQKLSNYEYSLAGWCTRNNSSAPEIVALLIPTDTEYHENIVMAWQANRQTGQLEEISTENIKCSNPAWGL